MCEHKELKELMSHEGYGLYPYVETVEWCVDCGAWRYAAHMSGVPKQAKEWNLPTKEEA
jgi:hypothetical protein